jgi:hypothetical protein
MYAFISPLAMAASALFPMSAYLASANSAGCGFLEVLEVFDAESEDEAFWSALVLLLQEIIKA